MFRKPLSLRFIVSATLLGNTLEWYDIATFGFLVPLFAKLFFPESDSSQALMYTMFVIFCGTLTRPLGGILFGFIGDRFGRRIALLLSVSLMTIPVLLIGLLPTYLQIGIIAPILLSALRLFQGIAAGGEFPGAVTFLCESATPSMRAFYGSFAFFGIGLGILLGGINFFYLQTYFSPENFANWGWRIIFIVGALLGLSAFLMRRKLHETRPFQKMREEHETLRDPVWSLLKRHKVRLFQAIGITILETVGFNLILPFSLIFLTDILNIPFEEAVRLNLLSLALVVITVPFAGKLASKVGSKNLAIWTTWAFLILSVPLYQLLHFEYGRMWGSIGLALLLSCYWGSIPAIYAELFPSTVRFSGVGLGYNLTVGVLGGLCPIIAFALIAKSNSTMIPPIMLMCAALIALLILKTIRVDHRSSLR